MAQTFKLTINMGNDAMREAEHVAGALNRTVDAVACGFTNGAIIDDNGNTVGRWEFVLGPPSEFEECDECDETIPPAPGGSLTNMFHHPSCSLYNPNEV